MGELKEDTETLRVWVKRCDQLCNRRYSFSSNNFSVKVYEIPAEIPFPAETSYIQRPDPAVTKSFPVTYIFGTGKQDNGGNIFFPEFDRARCTEVKVTNNRLRFEVTRHLRTRNRTYVVGFAEISIEDLKKRRSWRLLLSDPVTHEAIYGGDRTKNIRKPSFLILQTMCYVIEGEAVHSDFSDTSPTTRRSSPARCSSPRSLPNMDGQKSIKTLCVTASRPARNRLSTSGSRRMGRHKVHIITRGTRGDVQPFVALARGLALPPYNCDITICTEIVWKDFVKKHAKGLPDDSLKFRPCGGNTMRKMGGAAAQWVMRNGQFFDTLQALMLSRSEVEFFPSEGCFFHWCEEDRPDFVLFGLTCTHVAMIISEKLKIPIVGYLLQPTSEIQPRSAPISATDQALDPLGRLVSGPQFNAAIKQIMEHLDPGISLNTLRLSRGLLPAPRDIREYSVHYSILAKQKIPLLTPINPLLKGSTASYLPGLTFTDFIFLRGIGGVDKLDDEISGFISKAKSEGRPIVLITFSSMPVGERKLLKLATSICQFCRPQYDDPTPRNRKPAVIAMAAGQAFDPAPDDLLEEVENLNKKGRLLVLRKGAPFGALFPLLDALVLHGGLGVTSEAFYAGLPVVTCGILVMDQRYWAARCDEIGCGCEGEPIDQAISPSDPEDSTSPPRIVELVNKALDKRSSPDGHPTWTQKAQELQKQLMPDPDKDDGGLAANAREVYRCGIEEGRIVENAYIDQQGCIWAFFRQLKCCGNCWFYCILWCMCAQIPRLLLLLLVCLNWIFFRGPKNCVRRACCPKKKEKIIEDDDDFDFEAASPAGASELTYAVACFTMTGTANSSPKSSLRGFDDDIRSENSAYDLEAGIGEESQIQNVLPCSNIRHNAIFSGKASKLS